MFVITRREYICMKNKVFKISVSIMFALAAIFYLVMKQNPIASTIFEGMNNSVAFPALGLMHKIGWNAFSTMGVVFCFAISIYLAFFLKDNAEDLGV